MFEIVNGDCVEAMDEMDESSVDAIVTDPPYGLSFMGRDWDKALPPPEAWEQALRVAKPGAHMVAFGAPRLYHRLACQIEDAGWEIRDCLMWLYGTGFPKSLNVSKAIDKAAGAEREVVGARGGAGVLGATAYGRMDRVPALAVTAPATDAAREWDGWGTALKPAWEPIILARKPLRGTVAANVLAHGTGALNVDACRIGNGRHLAWSAPRGLGYMGSTANEESAKAGKASHGRWPANLALDERAADVLGERSRFFYCAKASKSEREAGLPQPDSGRANQHPTVKPISLMRWLVRLVTPPGGLVLDPFAGSGSTGCAAAAEGFRFIGCERDARHAEVSRARIKHWAKSA